MQQSTTLWRRTLLILWNESQIQHLLYFSRQQECGSHCYTPIKLDYSIVLNKSLFFKIEFLFYQRVTRADMQKDVVSYYITLTLVIKK